MRIRFLAAIALVLAAASAGHAQPTLDPSATYPVARDGAPSRGPLDAPVTIVEFSDFRCQFCLRSQYTLEQLQRLYPGQLRLVYRQLPLDMEEGTLAAEASLAADAQGAFWPMHDRLFGSPGPFTREVIESYARELGLDLARFRRDLDERTHLPEVARDYREAERLGFNSTPMFFVNGRPIRGAQPLAVFAAVVEEELRRAEELVRSGVAREAVYEQVTGGARAPAPGASAAEAWPSGKLEPLASYAVGLGLPGHTVGPDDALVTIVEFTDFECGFCAKLAPTLEQVRAAYGADVRIVYRHLPLRFHANALLAAEAAVEAAAQGKLPAFARLLFRNQRALSRADLERYARRAGLDLAQFRAALDDRRHLDAVEADAAAANALGVTGTPTLFVNGTPVVGAVPADQLTAIVEAKLHEARAIVASGGIERRHIYSMIAVGADRRERGDLSRIPADSAAGTVERDQGEYQRAVVSACHARDPERARRLFDKLKHEDGRELARAQCEPHGVDLRP